MSITFLFPGQGSESTGMLGRLPSAPIVQETLRAAEEVLHFPTPTLDTESALLRTENVQVALFIAGVASARWLMEANVKPQFVAGHSVGAFAAAVVAGVLTLEDGLELVIRRAESMVRAAPGDTGMAVLAGAPLALLEDLISPTDLQAGSIYIANRNSPDQIVIAGKRSIIASTLERARALHLRRAQMLSVALPSHTPWMNPVAENLLQLASKTPTRPPDYPFASNVTGRLLYNQQEIIADLALGVAKPVNWIDCMNALQEAGTDIFLEMPPGNVLTRIASNRFPGTRSYSVESMSIPSIIKASAFGERF